MTSRRSLAVALLLVVCAGFRSGPADAADRRELEAREAFVTGHYERALDLFAKLYAETLHPTYLRNIARCYQNLGDADRALTSFRDYLRKAGPLPAKERAEIDEYIAEMEALKRKQERQRQSPPRPTPSAPAVALVAPAPPPAEAPRRSLWWLWTGLAVVAAGAAVAAFTLGRGGDAPCPAGTRCFGN